VSDVKTGLSPDEDEMLRRIQWFEDHGWELSEAMRSARESMRQRDRRSEIRLPRQLTESPGDARLDEHA
jgi:hypothetical protein